MTYYAVIDTNVIISSPRRYRPYEDELPKVRL